MAARVISILFLAIFVASAWQISGKVTDIRGKALSGAQVCDNGNASNCVTASTTGTFSISGVAVALRADRATGSSHRTFIPEMRKEKLFLDAPAAARVRIEWFNAAGSRLGPANTLKLTKGINLIATAPSYSGVLLLRLCSGSFSQTWKLAMSGIGNQTARGPFANELSPRQNAVAPAFPVVKASQSGYTSRNYYATDVVKDTLAWIMLPTTQDDTTFKLAGTSYAISAIPPNQLVKTVSYACYACPTAFGGKKVGYLGTAGSVIYGNVFAPKDSTFLVTVGYECANNDAHSNCSLKPGAKTNACRPIQFKVNNQVVNDTLWTECESAKDWCHDLFDSIPLPLKAGLNNVELFTTISDLPDMDRLIVKDGRSY